jgi:hypothetical protein
MHRCMHGCAVPTFSFHSAPSSRPPAYQLQGLSLLTAPRSRRGSDVCPMIGWAGGGVVGGGGGGGTAIQNNPVLLSKYSETIFPDFQYTIRHYILLYCILVRQIFTNKTDVFINEELGKNRGVQSLILMFLISFL